MSRASRRKLRPTLEGLEVREVPVGWFSLPYLVMIKAMREHQAEVAAAAFRKKHPNHPPAQQAPPPAPGAFHYPFGRGR